MNILTLSPDGREIESQNSPIIQRFLQYGTLVERFDVIYPSRTTHLTRLSDHVTLYGIQARTKAEYVLRLWFFVRSLQKTTRYDVLSTPDPYFLGSLTLLFGYIYRIGVEIQVHGLEKWRGIRPWLARFNLRRAQQLRTVSKRLATTLVQTCGVLPSRISTFPIFINANHFVPVARERSSSPHAPFTSITVSRLVPIKHIELQLRAIALVSQKHDIQHLIVGDGPLRQALERLARELGIQKHVSFCGAQKDIVPFLARADIFLLTSDMEGYGMAPIEAACSGLPVIMTDVGCANEVILDRVHGLILPTRPTAETLANAIELLIKTPDLRHSLAVNASMIVGALPSQASLLQQYRQSWERARNIA